ncbi:FAD-dependent monooxygenase [Piscinibacter sakaiensis]|uniref:2-octaprenyl-6-methoxyphenol hydroxylase n=1 Tax=Piscinibacter sakaiensis TaxID=1547922 RepID=A0A0K8NYV9_PISS1|nr:FAD-dependent monooxygenase [Piscinibacter sakaiensis]GAP35484.1 2-octaprenyl-6-methoxyphenol hydroxylase [Piscinibacter sakaiensis]
MVDPEPLAEAPPAAAVPLPASAPSLAVVGAGPAGLALALRAAEALPQARITVFDARPLDKDVGADARTLALSLGSVQLLQWLGVWRGGIEAASQPITEVQVSQQPAVLGPLAQALWRGPGDGPRVCIRAADEGVAQLGAVVAYGAIVAPMQAAWLARCAAEPQRCLARFGTPVAALKPVPGGVEVDAGIAETHDLAVVAEGGVFAEQARKGLAHDYRQTAWVGQVEVPAAPPGVAWERFTREGPAALLPLRPGRAALVWCVASDADPVAALDEAQRLALLNTVFPAEVGPITAVSPLKRFPLGLNAERRLVDGRVVRIGNAAQTLHPVAGQGLNLGLRDAHELVEALHDGPDLDAALRRVERRRAPDRWAMIAATDFLARSFTWTLPGAGLARGAGMAALQALGPVRSLLARRMMFGSR